MCEKRTCAFDVGVESSDAESHVLPPSVLTSTRVILPRPDHARPVTGHQPRVSVNGYDVPILPESGVIQAVIYWSIVAEANR